MSEQILKILKARLDENLADDKITDPNIKQNIIKEILQYFVLSFIYHHPEYNKWIMYGGSALRIIHGLNRMSEDLDFEVSHLVTDEFLRELKKEIEDYFANTYGAGADFFTVKITTGRGLLLKFHVGKELNLGHPSNQVHVKIDLNYFVAHKTVVERRPINRDQLSFVISVYNMSALMASKLAAIFLRGIRGVGEAVYEEKGRDIYDLLWYMEKRVVPDFDYLVAKGVDVKDPRALFNKLTLQMNKVSDINLKNDLSPLFLDQTFIADWLSNWRASYFELLKKYKIRTITKLREVVIHQDFHTDNLSFIYFYDTEENDMVSVEYNISDYWFRFREGELSIQVDNSIVYHLRGKVEHEISDRYKQCMTLFRDKNKEYFEKTNKVILGDNMTTKLIRMTADRFNPREQIILDKSTLLSCELEDLLK